MGVGGDKHSLNDRWKGLGAKLLVVLPQYWLHSGRQQRRRLECSPTPLFSTEFVVGERRGQH